MTTYLIFMLIFFQVQTLKFEKPFDYEMIKQEIPTDHLVSFFGWKCWNLDCLLRHKGTVHKLRTHLGERGGWEFLKVGFQMVGLEQWLKLSENWTIQNLDYIVRISFVYQDKSRTIGLLSIQIDKYEISK